MARKRAKYKTGNNGSGASLGFERTLRVADEMRSYVNPSEHKYVVLGLDLEGSRDETS